MGGTGHADQDHRQSDRHDPVSGERLANDALGSPFLGLRLLVGGEFQEVGDAGRQLTGAYGTLTVDEVGHYTHQPLPDLTYAGVDPVDSFTYQIVQPDGQVSTARLDVAIDINNGATPVFPPTLTASHDAAPVPTDHADAPLVLSLMEGQGSIEDVLGRYLDMQGPAAEKQSTIIAAEDVREIPTVTDISTEDSTPYDALGYPTVSVDAEQEKPAATSPC